VLCGCDAWIKTLGTVRDTAGKPISNATVNLKSKSESLTFRTGNDGRYVFSIWQPPFKTDYTLTVTKTGFVRYEKQLRGPGIYEGLDVVLEPAPPDSGAPQEVVTPQSIARAMFPNAPEKAKSADCFRGLSRDMSMNKIVGKCGRPDEVLGSGIYIFVWHLDDRSTASIGTPYLERIGSVRLTDASGKTSSLLE
jgi:hypothetical protein